jgi:hypothetical protein
VVINVYGYVFESLTPLNFEMRNSIMITDYVQGILINVGCTLVSPNSLSGNITFYNYTQKGERYKIVSNPLLKISTFNNVTVDNS